MKNLFLSTMLSLGLMGFANANTSNAIVREMRATAEKQMKTMMGL